MLSHFVVVLIIAVGGSFALLISMVVGALLVAHAQTWFSTAKRERPRPERTFDLDVPPHSVPANAL